MEYSYNIAEYHELFLCCTFDVASTIQNDYTIFNQIANSSKRCSNIGVPLDWYVK